MSAEMNLTIGARSVSMGADVCNLEPMARDESEVPMTQALLEVGSVSDPNAAESATSLVGLSFPSSDGVIYSRSRARAVIGAIS